MGRGEAGGDSDFRPGFLTRTAVEWFLSPVQAGGYGASRRAGTKNAISGFCVGSLKKSMECHCDAKRLGRSGYWGSYRSRTPLRPTN